MTTVGLIGRIAVQLGMITREQLQHATREQGRQPGRRLGEVLIELGYIDEGQLGALLAAQARAEGSVRRSRRATPVPAKKNVPEGVTLGAVALKRVAISALGVSAAPQATAALRRDDTEARAWLLGLLTDANVAMASDVIVLPNQPVRLRRFGRVHDFTTGAVSDNGTQRLLMQTLSPEESATLARDGQVSVTFEAPSVGRYRLQVHRDLAGVGGTFHRVHPPEAGTSLADLSLPNWMAGLVNFPHGLVLLTGPMGSGRSTTMSALVHLVTEERSDHIVIVQTPREHRPVAGEALISQLEVGVHCQSVVEATRDAPRMDADVLCIDELPSDAVDAALRAADTDQLVIATTRSLSAVRSIEQLIDCFPAEERRVAENLVADCLKAVVSQRLIPAIDRDGAESGVVPALEVIQVDDAIRELIRSDRLAQIAAHVQAGRAAGSTTLDATLTELLRQGFISTESARANARNPALFTPKER